MSKKNKNNKGFTLIELLIAITLFTIVSTIAFTALNTILKANQKAKTMKVVVNNLNMAMESMARRLRVGSQYTCNKTTPIDPGKDGVNCKTISFKTQDNKNAYFKFVENGDNVGNIVRKIEGTNGSSEVSLIGTDLDVDDLTFKIIGTNTTDIQPRVIILLTGHIGRYSDEANKKGLNLEGTQFDLQTTISERLLAP